MEINYFDLSGGVNQASTKTELGLNTNTIYWSDSKNIEILESKGITKQKGNSLLVELPQEESVTGIHQLESEGVHKLIITTAEGNIYVYSESSDSLVLIEKQLTGNKVLFENFLRGVLIATESDKMFYLKNNSNYETVDCELKDLENNSIIPDCITVYKGRVWCAKGSTIYYSALGSYNDFTSENDAGYINDFHTDTADIIGMKTYKNYLAIYKKERVYLLGGTSPEDFAIIPFADKGSLAKDSIVNVDNRQYFLSNGIYSLEQVGELNQIRLGSEISQNIKKEFELFDMSRLNQSFALHYQNKHQMWFFFPYVKEQNYHTVWINDYVNKAWLKRVIPQNITAACNYKSYIVSADTTGKVYIEDYGKSFNGQAIKFFWKSPFLTLTNPHHRKLIDEFYFVLDNEYENRFNFSVYKDFDEQYPEDKELIYSKHYNQLVWATENTTTEDILSCWAQNGANIPVWAIGTDTMEKAEICGSCLSVQLCVEGKEIEDNCAIIGLQFREIYNDD